MSRKLRASQAIGGARRDRTADLLRARQALSQLSYGPFNLSFSCHATLDLSPAWSHAHMHAPGARVKSALPGAKNPALKRRRIGLDILWRTQKLRLATEKNLCALIPLATVFLLSIPAG